MKKQSLAKNFIYQFLYQGLILIIPFILSPYLTRTLRESALGTYTYVNSIAYYFVIAGNLGIGVHGKRTIARNSGNETALRKSFWSLFGMHAVISMISAMAYIFMAVFIAKDDKVIYYIETFYVLSALFDITWLFYGLENFKSVVIKNTAVKVTECILIFLCVKSPGDLWKYTLISAGSLLAGQMVMLPQAMSIIKPIRFTWKEMTEHIKPMLIFSVALIAASLYTVFDKTLLGMMTTKENVAFYEYSNRIVSLPRTFVEVASSVMFPRACKLAAEGNQKEQKKYINYSFIITAFIGVGAIFGLAAVAKPFAILYYGEAFSVCGPIIIALSPLVYIIGSSKILRAQCLIPNGMDKAANICIVINAIVNLVLSMMLIPSLGIYGAVIGTFSAELCGFILQSFLCRKFVDFSIIPKSLLPFIISGALMYGAIILSGQFLSDNIIGILAKVIIGGGVYLILTVLYLAVFHKNILQLVLKKVKRKGM